MKFKLLTFILAFLLSACSLIEDSGKLCPVTEDDGKGFITMNFRMVTSSTMQSRADDYLHPEVESEWPLFEDNININDFAFFIFTDLSDGNRPLVMKMTDITSSSDPNTMVFGSPGAYTVTTVIRKASLEDELGHEISPDNTDKIQFRIVVLANVGNGYNYDLLDTSSFDSFINQASEIMLSLPGNIYHGNSLSAEINNLYTGAIPMFGMITFEVTEEKIFNSRQEEKIWSGNIDMLRSLAKIRVLDNIETKDEETGLPRIEAVSVQGRTPNAYILPSDATDYQNGMQIHDPNTAPADGAASSQSIMRLGYLSTYPTKFFGYIPEQSIRPSVESDMEDNITVSVDITVTYEVDTSGKPTLQRTYSIPLTGYQGQTFSDFGDNILRNHIYTLSVTGAETTVTIEVEVKEWDETALQLEYTELVTVTKKLEWTVGTYANSSHTEIEQYGSVVMLPWAAADETSLAHPVPLEGKFRIKNPLGATWTAYLLYDEGVTDSFAFLDDDGEQKQQLSGVVNGSESDIILRIVTTNEEPTEQNSVKLQVVVTLADGATVIEAPMTPANSEYKNYTIIQNPL